MNKVKWGTAKYNSTPVPSILGVLSTCGFPSRTLAFRIFISYFHSVLIFRYACFSVAMNRNRCIVCAQCFYISELRRSPRSKTIGAVLLSCLTISDYPGIHTVKDSFDRWHLRLKWICHKHFVDAVGDLLLVTFPYIKEMI